MQNPDRSPKKQNVINENMCQRTKFTGSHDRGHPEMPGKAYIAGVKGRNAEYINSDDLIMLDIFGALNY